MADRHFRTLPDDISDAYYFKLLEKYRIDHLRRLRGSGGGERMVRRTGGAVEFAGHRSYDPGDDLRYLDWHLLARLNSPFTKTFHDQEYHHVHLLLDASASMEGMDGGRKFRIAQDVASALSFLVLANDDRLRVACTPGSAKSPYLYASQRFLIGRHQMPILRRFLTNRHVQGITAFDEGFAKYAHENQRRMSTLVIVSDFLSEIDDLMAGLASFTATGCHMVLIRIVEPQERALTPDRSMVKIRDMETGAERTLSLDDSNRAEYSRAFESHARQIRQYCQSHRIAYGEIDTGEPWYDPRIPGSLLEQLRHLNLLRTM
jgi:uncharacterized protein (DUF58 family)